MEIKKIPREPFRLDWIAIALAGLVLLFSAAAIVAFVPAGPCPRCGIAHAETVRWSGVVVAEGYPASVRARYASLLQDWHCDYCRGRGKYTLLDRWKAERREAARVTMGKR